MIRENHQDNNLGSKAASGAYQAIISLMPPHDLYIEPFLGSGTIMQKKAACAQSIGLDLNVLSIEKARNNIGNESIEIINGDGLAFIENYDFSNASRPFIYADPPYLHETRTSKKRYAFEFDTKDHKRLLEAALKLASSGVNVMLSGYPNALYDDILIGWCTREFRVMTRGGVRTEKLWLSYSPDAIHWSHFAGVNFTDRQRIQRKAARWAKKFHELPASERQAILAAMLAGDSEN